MLFWLVNPNEAVPHLFALQGDVGNSNIRSIALKLLMHEGEKRPDMLRQRICAGVQKAYVFQRRHADQNKPVTALLTTNRGQKPAVECIFGPIFKESIASSQKLRHGLFKSLLSLFQRGLDSSGIGTERVDRQPKDIALLSFASQILAHLSSNTLTDPLFIIYHIASIIALQGAAASDEFSSLLRPVGLASSDEFDEQNSSEDFLEKAAKVKSPSGKQKLGCMTDVSKFDLHSFFQLCHEAASLSLLLRLKAFLRRSYSLTEARCLDYDPSSKDTIADKNVHSKNDNGKPFDASVAAFSFFDHGERQSYPSVCRVSSFDAQRRGSKPPDFMETEGEGAGHTTLFEVTKDSRATALSESVARWCGI